MIKNNYDYVNPTPISIALFTQSLANKFSHPISVHNAVSGARRYVEMALGTTEAFDSHLMKVTKRGLDRTNTHVPQPAPALSARLVARVADVLYHLGPAGTPARAALLMGFCSFLRPSNLLAAGGAHPLTHTITRADVIVTSSRMSICVRSSKTTTAKDTYIVPIRAAGGNACPVQAWRDYIALYPAHAHAPAFVNKAGTPFTQEDLNPLIRATLDGLGFPEASGFTFHSLRRSGARAAAVRGATKAQVMRHGHWRSDAVHAYVPKDHFE